MTSTLFEWPLAWWLGVPLAAALLLAFARSSRRRGRSWKQVSTLTACRVVAVGFLLYLAARPVHVDLPQEPLKRDQVALLVDRSESMSLQDFGTVRFQDALKFARLRLLPALRKSELKVTPWLFAEDAQVATGRQIAQAVPEGKQTNLARAIVRTLGAMKVPPLAVIALSDGAATEEADNQRAMTLLVENQVPFIGVGFGRETGTRTLTIEHVEAPPVAPRKQEFRIAAALKVSGAGELPKFDLLLHRDGRMIQRKTAEAGSGARTWLEHFQVTETEAGLHRYTVQMFPPDDPALKCPNVESTVAVRIIEERELRVLFVQGGLTWDFKFIQLALRGDPTIKLTGLSRTASQSMFFQNVETDAELVEGFPATIEQMSSFRVVVLSNLKPSDLTPPQQELLARFCREFGGGVLLIGGSDTFNASWHQSKLEQLLPVEFSTASAPPGGEPPFRIQLSDAASTHPAFQIGETGDNRSAWDKVPTFTHFAAVEKVKPAAQVWAVHPAASGPHAQRALIASQRYGAGLSAVICVQNFWRWRLAKEAETRHFDRFWQQLLRYLAEGSSESIAIRMPEVPLRSGSEVSMILEPRPTPTAEAAGPRNYTFRVESETKEKLTEQTVELAPQRPATVKFRVERPGVYTAAVLDAQGILQATRSFEIRDIDQEFVAPARNMENLRQWAGLSRGIALAIEDDADTDRLIQTITAQIDQTRRAEPHREPAGINGWVLAALLTALCAEWLLRKRWGMV
ncbi:MAG TPA: hypothetical protein VMV69_14480 [Pirellulales bacterium]|nr:hypothetical protein [Pirellulales bacterium]